MKNELMALPLAEAAALGWPEIKKERSSDSEVASLGDLIRLMRNGIAHGNLAYLSDGKGEICAIRLWNSDRTGSRTWGAVISVVDIRHFLDGFVDLIERRHKDLGWYQSGAA